MGRVFIGIMVVLTFFIAARGYSRENTAGTPAADGYSMRGIIAYDGDALLRINLVDWAAFREKGRGVDGIPGNLRSGARYDRDRAAVFAGPSVGDFPFSDRCD